EPDHDPNQWRIVPPSPTPGWLEKSTAAVAWDTATLHVSYASGLEASQPDVAAALSKVTFDNDMLTAMTYALSVEGQDPAAFAAQWVEENARTVDRWFE
ncbi:MAG: glycine betaine ABC transporter substrate-binding protein, partial [Tateyamaria sp.]